MRLFPLFLPWLLLACSPKAGEHLELAQKARYAHNFEEALRQYRRAIDLLEGQDSSRATVLRARALKGAADTYYLDLRDIKTAVEVYRELLVACPRSPESIDARIVLADILHQHLRDTRGAIRELALAIAQNPPQSDQLRYQMSKFYFEMTDFEQCALEAASMVEAYPSSAYVDDALYLRGQALAMMPGRTQEAIRVFQDLVDRLADSPLRGHALFEKGKAQEALGLTEKAIDTWILALKLHPTPATIQQVIARARRRMSATTPGLVGEKNDAFGHAEVLPTKKPPPIQIQPPATSVEAAGGTAAEAEWERQSASDGMRVKP